MVHHCGLSHADLPPPEREPARLPPAWPHRRQAIVVGLGTLVLASTARAAGEQAASVAMAASAASSAGVPALATAAAAPPSALQAPLYATRMPPAARLEYSLRSGLMRGTGQLHWAPAAEGYRATLEGHVFGLPVLSWTSEGGFDRHGLAPLRFTDERLNRAPRIAQFRRDTGRIAYTGRTTERPLPAGAQDRLSWMLQVPAILLADAALQATGRRIRLFVTGARGDAAVWTFEVRGRDSLDLPAGRVPDALHLKRVPDEPGDPARGLLPVRARFSAADGRDETDFLLSR
jgi:hypothetical protein